jgi:hypothetical protein
VKSNLVIFDKFVELFGASRYVMIAYQATAMIRDLIPSFIGKCKLTLSTRYSNSPSTIPNLGINYGFGSLATARTGGGNHPWIVLFGEEFVENFFFRCINSTQNIQKAKLITRIFQFFFG